MSNGIMTKGFNPDRYYIHFNRDGKRPLTAPELDILAANAAHRDCGGAIRQGETKWQHFAQCDKCGEYVDPKAARRDGGVWYNGERTGGDDDTPTPAPKAAPKAAAVPADKAAALGALLDLFGGGGSADPEQVEAIARKVVGEALDTARREGAFTTRIEVTRQDAPVVKLDGTVHASFEAILKRVAYKRANGTRFNILLVGPKGCGKTHVVAQVAKALGQRYGALSCGAGTTDGEIVGRVIPNLTTGEATLQSSLFLDFYANGGVFLLDELDALNPTTALRLNMALENGRLFDALGREVPRHEHFYCFAAANTWGHGANREYCGREMQDAALLDRFIGGEFDFGYDEGVETALCPDAELRRKLWAIRAKVGELKLQRRSVSTRALLAAYELKEGLGMTTGEAIREVLKGWTEADRKAVGA